MPVLLLSCASTSYNEGQGPVQTYGNYDILQIIGHTGWILTQPHTQPGGAEWPYLSSRSNVKVILIVQMH